MSDIINCFPGYTFVKGDDGKMHNMYRDTDVGFGGYVYAEPGMYTNVALLDIGNMHGASIIALNKFGEYTKNYKEIRDARMAIKAHDFEKAKTMLDGKLAPYLNDEDADSLQGALKLILNSTYGIAAATFDNPLRDPRDKNNIIACRGALFMRTLQDEVVERGFTVAHIKTDSIKIPNATDEIIEFVKDFGRKYGYEFEHEATYEKLCLVNDAVYIAKYDDKGVRNKGGKHASEWTATGAEFQHPYIFKTLFSHEPVEFKDFCETKEVGRGGELYLDMNENLPDVTELEKEREKLYKKWLEENTRDATEMLEDYDMAIAEGHNYKFVGKVGEFCPIAPGNGGGILYRMKDGKYYAVAGTKGYRWLESETVKAAGYEDRIDMLYFQKLVDDAVEHIKEFGDFEWFVSDDKDVVNTIVDGPEEVPFDEDFKAMNPPA